MKLSDLRGIQNKSTATIISVDNPYGDYYVVAMQTEPGFTWEAGKHGFFSLPGKKIKGRKSRAFSFASIPSEGRLLVGTRTGEKASSFKAAFLSMKPGDKVQLRGPMGGFLVQDTSSPMIFIASGVGITPFRALFEALRNDVKRPIELVYASRQYYLFGDEIDQIAEANDQMTVYKTHEIADTKAKIEQLAKKYGSEAYYYISGAPAMIQSTMKDLKALGVKKDRMISDEFLGYKS